MHPHAPTCTHVHLQVVLYMPSLFAQPEKVLPLLSDKAVNSSISFKELMKRASHIKPYDPIPQVVACICVAGAWPGPLQNY